MAMRLSLLIAPVLIAMALPRAAHAQSNTSTKNVPITGFVPIICAGGTLAGGDTFDVGVLIDTTTGFLRTDLSAPNQVLAGSFCSTRATINVLATPMVAQNFAATPPGGFSRQVDYVATASGWTTTPASYNTAAATNLAATQSRATAFTGPITVGIGGFATGGGSALRLVADTNYRGTVTVTLTAAD